METMNLFEMLGMEEPQEIETKKEKKEKTLANQVLMVQVVVMVIANKVPKS